MIDIHYWIISFVYPTVNLFLLVVAMWGYIYTRYSWQFALIGASALLSAFITTVFLILKLQKAFDITIIAKSVARVIWPFQALAEYASIALYSVGIVWLVASLVKNENKG